MITSGAEITRNTDYAIVYKTGELIADMADLCLNLLRSLE
jgi:hypothetical protein